MSSASGAAQQRQRPVVHGRLLAERDRAVAGAGHAHVEKDKKGGERRVTRLEKYVDVSVQNFLNIGNPTFGIQYVDIPHSGLF